MRRSGRTQLVFLGIAVLQAFMLLACAPYLSDTHPEIRQEPAVWQCPTPSPIPTVLLRYDSNNEPPPTPTTTHAVYSTPVPTATPYIRTGSDFFSGQRVRVGPLLLRATSSTDAMGIPEVQVTVENQTGAAVEFHLDLSLIRAIRQADGRAAEGTWYPTTGAGNGLWQPGTMSVTLHFNAPVGEAEAWGLPLYHDDQRRNGQSGNGYVWVRFATDPHCGGKAGGPPSDAYNAPPPVALPVVGRGGWPVPPGTTISRGYGCTDFYTGVHGSCPDGQWWHDGVDFANVPGTPLVAIMPMHIEYAGPDTGSLDCSWMSGSQAPHTGFGLYVRGSSGHYAFWYGHTRAFTVSAGGDVGAGTEVAEMGATGCATGPHVHFRVRVDGLDRDPFDVLQKP